MDSIKQCFNAVLRGNEKKSRLAARQVRKSLYGSRLSQDDFNDIKNIVSNAARDYGKISEEWRQENFVIAVSVIYYLHGKDEQPDFLFPWLLELLKHKNGYIRHAAVRMLKNEIGPLTVHIRYPNHPAGYFDKLKPETADNIICSLFAILNNLLADLWQPKYKKYKYISSLPAGPYKSAQMVLAELEESCGKKYIDSFKMLNKTDSSSGKEKITKKQIFQKRKEIEQEFTKRLKRINSPFDFQHILDVIYNEDGQDDLSEVIRIFDDGNIFELENILELATDAWNYFPHRLLDGKSPMEMS